FPKRKAYDADLQANGIRLDQFHTLQARSIDLKGTLNLNAKGSGTLDDPNVQFSAQIPQLQIQNQNIDGITLQANIANRIANVAIDSRSQTLNSYVRGHGQVKLTGDYPADAAFDTSSISLQPLLAIYAPAQAADLTGQTE